jgi:hypothetical protein
MGSPGQWQTIQLWSLLSRPKAVARLKSLTSDESVVDDRRDVIQEVEVGHGAVDVVVREGRSTGLHATRVTV